jgi:hypothetical protein
VPQQATIDRIDIVAIPAPSVSVHRLSTIIAAATLTLRKLI